MARSRKVRDRASYANVTATLALFVALGGGSFAVAALSGQEKKVVKKIANKQADKRIKKRAPGLSVANAQNATNAQNANSATTAGNGAAGYAEFTQTGAARSDAFNMNDLTVSTMSAFVYCEDQPFKSVVASGGLAVGGLVRVSVVSKEQLAAAGATPEAVGCPPNTEWLYQTTDATGNNPGPFTVHAF